MVSGPKTSLCLLWCLVLISDARVAKPKLNSVGHISSGPVMYFIISNEFSQSLYLKDILIHIFTKLNAGP